MTPDDLSIAFADIIQAVVERKINTFDQGSEQRVVLSAQDIVFERPKNRDHGDWATNIALKMAKSLGCSAREFATEIADAAVNVDGVETVEVAGPGFINVRLQAGAAGALVRTIVERGSEYGTSAEYAGHRINLEFVSANPTGPVHLGGARWAAVGDSLARILEAVGAEVVREYYFNDHGSQIDRFASSLLASYLKQPAPEDGYAGQYIEDIAQRVAELSEKDLSVCSDDVRLEVFRSLGTQLMFDQIKQELSAFGVDFAVYFHEDSLHTSGAVDRAIARLQESGHVFSHEGALWLRTTDFGDDRDRVIVRANGQPAYISGDIGYYLDKRERGFEYNIILLGADHHGYVARLMAMVAAFGDTPGVHLQVLIGQLVTLIKDGSPVKMSKRAGTIVTLDDLVEAVGVDAARYVLVRSSIDSQIDVDLDLLATRTHENPVYYVQYAHARTCAVGRRAAEAGITREIFDPGSLTHATESALLGVLQEYPRIVLQTAALREPHRVARYLEELAGLYHTWYAATRVVPLAEAAVEPVHHTRLWLNDAVRQVFSNGLCLLGVSAPERM